GSLADRGHNRSTAARHPRRQAPMDTEFTRFRINPALRDQAMQVCARLGVELSDVLRALVTRIAHDGAIPFAMPAAESPTAPASPPSTDGRPVTATPSQ